MDFGYVHEMESKITHIVAPPPLQQQQPPLQAGPDVNQIRLFGHSITVPPVNGAGNSQQQLQGKTS
ncbi:hypothetical protein Dsin_024114 [Dipteronia sinensis]|uniref:Uncharacterized protein n=1 Tax=Dipteronia sinensis TaxID=43782 RepID=A0AAE0A653_9ROSI|nr:hypothetical protein Dsin_024114 [Dipteronia sinensis]